MAQRTKLPEMTVREAQYRIFLKLSVDYRRSHQDPAFGLRADDVRRELAIPEDVFAEALNIFRYADNQMTVEVFERKGERYLRLGESGRYNCSD
ncbi:MAG TPA: hypothetical protein VGK77_21470 [Candidatus Binatia bacterium]|jgi:hypothetical protein